MSQAKNQYSLIRNIWRNLGYFWRIDKGSMLAYLSLASLQVASSLLIVFFTSRIIGDLALAITNQNVNTTRLYELLAALGVSMLAQSFAWQWMGFVKRKSWAKFTAHNYRGFNAATSRLDMPTHHNRDMQKMLAKLYTGYSSAPTTFAYDTLNLIHAFARAISTLIIIIGFAPWLFLIVLIALTPNFFVNKKLSQLVWGIWGLKGDEWRLAFRTAHFLDNKDSLQETKVFGTRNFLLDKLESLFGGFYKEQVKSIRKIEVPAFGAMTLETLMFVGVNLWLIKKVINHSLSLANFSFYIGIISQLSSSITIIIQSLSSLYDDNQFISDLYKLFDTEPALPVSARPQKIKDGLPTIEFKDVSFRYPNSKKYALKDVSFTLKPNDKVAFVGENGAGKTTIIKLLLRFYDPTEGQILVDGINIQELDLDSYYNHICVLFQSFNSYPYSVRDNIALGRVEDFKNDKRVHRAARESGANKFIGNYPLGYDQILEVGFKDGIEPSGGQWQRIALARALFRDAGILILDEPTAAVDANAEYAIFKKLEEHSAKRTTIIISHRFSTVRMAHQIYVIHNGEIIEKGSHTSLLKIKGGHYKEMFEKQAEGYR